MTLLSAPGAAAFGGPLWWAAVAVQARAAHPGLVTGDILDCGGAPGTALAAIRCGCATIALDPACPGWAAVAAVAAEVGATLLGSVPPAFDPGVPHRGKRDPARALAGWLAGDTHPALG